MGTVGILDALQRLQDSQAEGQAPVSADLVLFAPDYGIDDFRDRQAMLDRMVERTTVYVSEKDRLLWLSAAVNGVPRLGQGGEHLATGPGFDTIDVSPLRRYHPTGHEYHVFHPLVEQDLVELLVDGAAASARTHTVEATRDGQRYFTLADSPAPDAGEEKRPR
jgi:esterase/lipase superfamily enzyme